MPRPLRNTIISKRITNMRRDCIWYSSKRFYDSTKDLLVCPSLRDVERMEKRRESLRDNAQDAGQNDRDQS
ncbi:hypothetical protein DPQ33_13130 [Oceanidesulfovibrio indonesiensis]|uniref:Uncharacterized protein n=1 Tax=Oceanidesulfovibrio indonesiensis TaxID=54767 RepID=A0A7M3MCQ4_9BACT|nr:hypothetical protein [Oceanidesulfovibrio indonesiensis]TVM16257.1 hypothetical protein DPQ33_13130 [Oceanidesulfovibrio indonesiensis]